MRHFRLDFWLLTPVILLCCLSLLLLTATAPELANSQALFIFGSLIIFLIISRIDIALFVGTHKIIYLISILFLILPFIFGVASRGANRWLQFGQNSLQPSEIIKPFLFLTFAIVATSNIRFKLPLLILLFLVPGGIIFAQPDLGTALIVGVGWAVVFLSRISLKKTILAGIGLILLIIPIYSFILRPYQKERLQTFINPYSDPLGSGYHVIQSIIAVGSGGFFGRGLGHGTQSELQFLPENHTDFVFASVSESFGFFGSIMVIILYLIFIGRIYRISQETSDRTIAVWALGVMGSLSFQVFVNIGMNIGIAPVTGITLPFLSYGGSSLLSMSLTIGLLNSTIAKSPSSLV